MKTLYFLALVQFLNFGIFAQKNSSDTCLYDDNLVLYFEVDKLPKFQSNDFNTVMEYVYSNIKYPSQIDVQGKVIVSFIITKYGEIEQIKIEKSLCEECDDEVKKVLLSMPKWKAGKKNGKFVNTLLLMSVNFKLQ